jgi:nicotinate-nucleotide adenylyltransferase
MKVGLFGGSFNPPHQGHLHISNLATKKLALNQIWWIPTAQNNFKDKSIYEPYETRYKKCETLTQNNPKIYLKDFSEIRTETLVKKLQKKYPNYQFIWIMGADNLPRFHQWDNFRNLIKLLPFAIFSRDNFLPQVSRSKAFKIYEKLKSSNKKLPNFLIIRTKTVNISSTQIRKNV